MTRFILLIVFCCIFSVVSACAAYAKQDGMDLTPYDSTNVKAALDEKFHLYDKQHGTIPTQEEEWLRIQKTDNATHGLSSSLNSNNRGMQEEMSKTRRYMGIDTSRAIKDIDSKEGIDGIGISGSIKLP